MTGAYIFFGLCGATMLLLAWLGFKLKWIPALLVVSILFGFTRWAGDDLGYAMAMWLFLLGIAAVSIGLIFGFIKQRESLRG